MQGQSPSIRRAVLSMWLAVAAMGCGPIGYFGSVSRDATRALVDARDHGAQRVAPYEWTAALLYLERARELAGYARWQDALALGRRATALARAAAGIGRKAEAGEAR